MASYPAQLPQESPQAYQAACVYFGMGVERSQESVSHKLAKSRQIMSRWSMQHRWVERAATYDDAVRDEEAQERTKRHLADLEDHRTRYQQAGRSLYSVAAKMLTRMHKEVDGLELTPAALGILLRAFTTAGDMEAHALNLDELMPKMAGDDRD
jgi:hypothetical protein